MITNLFRTLKQGEWQWPDGTVQKFSKMEPLDLTILEEYFQLVDVAPCHVEALMHEWSRRSKSDRGFCRNFVLQSKGQYDGLFIPWDGDPDGPFNLTWQLLSLWQRYGSGEDPHLYPTLYVANGVITLGDLEEVPESYYVYQDASDEFDNPWTDNAPPLTYR